MVKGRMRAVNLGSWERNREKGRQVRSRYGAGTEQVYYSSTDYRRRRTSRTRLGCTWPASMPRYKWCRTASRNTWELTVKGDLLWQGVRSTALLCCADCTWCGLAQRVHSGCPRAQPPGGGRGGRGGGEDGTDGRRCVQGGVTGAHVHPGLVASRRLTASQLLWLSLVTG